jgi:hypothetical protein
MEMARARRIGVDHGDARQPAGHPQDEVAGNPLGRRERQHAI